MAVFRVQKSSNYTTVSNYHLRDKRLTLKAKGLLTLMLSLPDDWDYSAAGLVAICKEGEGAVKSALKELKECSYLVIEKLNPNDADSGRFEYVYNIYEQPCDIVENVVENKELPVKQEGRKQGVEKQGIEKQALENSAQLNTNNKWTKRRKIDDKEKAVSRKSNYEPPAPTHCPNCKQMMSYVHQMGRFECFNCSSKFDKELTPIQ